VNAAIYLQDNRDNGGGLDVVPGSHLRDDPLAAALRRERGLPNVNRMSEPVADPCRDPVSLRCLAGDVVIFHLRVSHRSSLRTRAADAAVSRLAR
jgi:ectoine hydroxylase-related dioxygenase (phytanoyl-CoA dioxygenase family)